MIDFFITQVTPNGEITKDTPLVFAFRGTPDIDENDVRLIHSFADYGSAGFEQVSTSIFQTNNGAFDPYVVTSTDGPEGIPSSCVSVVRTGGWPASPRIVLLLLLKSGNDLLPKVIVFDGWTLAGTPGAPVTPPFAGYVPTIVNPDLALDAAASVSFVPGSGDPIFPKGLFALAGFEERAYEFVFSIGDSISAQPNYSVDGHGSSTDDPPTPLVLNMTRRPNWHLAPVLYFFFPCVADADSDVYVDVKALRVEGWTLGGSTERPSEAGALWGDLENAIREIVGRTSGLPDDKIILSDEDGDKPNEPYISIRLGDERSIGSTDAVSQEFDLTAPNGSQIVHTVEAQRETTVSLQCFHKKGTGNNSARSIMSRVQLAFSLPSIVERLSDTGLSVFDVGTVQNLSAVFGPDFAGRAGLELRAYVPRELQERGTWIEKYTPNSVVSPG